MDKTTVFTKTAKGITQVNQKSASLSKDLMKVLKLIDGKSNFAQLMEKVELDKLQLERALNSLTKDGYARVFQVRKEEEDLFAEEDDFDFTAPGKIATPASTQRVVAGAANDISELVRQQEKADAERKSKEQAHEAARVRAKTEAETRAKLEAEARARQKAENEAMEQARRAKDAAERARAELETKLREEEARKRSMTEQQARFTAEQKAREEEESRRLADLRAKAEREAKALAEARARAEAEAQAMARARAEAEAAARRQAAEASSAEQQLKARLKDEIESRIRQEMESLLRNELEEKTRAEMSAQILAEARLAARAELEERLREEREQLARAEAEARRHAEKEALARAETESRKRAEAEARAAAETEARMKAEEEARRLRVQAERAREEAEVRAKEQKETVARLETERRGKIEAEARARVEAEERERRERELAATIDAERRAKEEAEARVRIEARARETVEADTRVKVQAELEADLEKKAEIEGKAQAKAYMAAKAKAELDEEEKIRQEQERKAREIAEVLRTRVEAPEAAPEGEPRKRSRRRAVKLAKPLLFAALGSIVLAIVLLHVVPLRGYTNRIERSLAAWLNDDVAIDTMTFRLVPKPHLAVQNMSVGKLLDAKAVQGRIFVDLATLFADRPRIDSIELENVSLSHEGVRKIPAWGRGHGAAPAGEGGGVGTIRLRNVNMDVRPNPGPFDATLQFSRDGALKQANLSSGGSLNVVLRPGPDGVQVDVTARNWSLPMGAPIALTDLTLKGVWSGNQIVAPELEGSALDGRFKGSARVTWAQGVKLESDLALEKVSAKDLVAAFTKDIAVIGRMDGSFRITTEGASVETLFASPRVQGKFRLGEGSISNVDLVAVMQSSEAGSRAGVTKFAELSGEITSADKRAQYRQVNLQGGVLRGNGTVEVANSALTGRLALEIRSQVAQDRGAFSVSGTVSRPVIRRGG